MLCAVLMDLIRQQKEEEKKQQQNNRQSEKYLCVHKHTPCDNCVVFNSSFDFALHVQTHFEHYAFGLYISVRVLLQLYMWRKQWLLRLK